MARITIQPSVRPELMTPKVKGIVDTSMWSGLLASGLGEAAIQSMVAFCRREGRNLGWAAAKYGYDISKDENPFHPLLLDGLPHREWRKAFLRGVENYRQAVGHPE